MKLIVLKYKIEYYKRLKDWMLWAKYKSEKIKAYPPKPGAGPNGLEVYIELNVFGAWEAFLNCSDKDILILALEWIDLAIKLDEGTRTQDYQKAAYFDTKANLLYKLGKVDEAIALEQKAYGLNPKNKEIQVAFEKMKCGQPTWPVKSRAENKNNNR